MTVQPNPIYTRRKLASLAIRKMVATTDQHLSAARATGDPKLVRQLEGLRKKLTGITAAIKPSR